MSAWVIASWWVVGVLMSASGYWMMFGPRRSTLFCLGVVLTVFGGVTVGTAASLTAVQFFCSSVLGGCDVLSVP